MVLLLHQVVNIMKHEKLYDIFQIKYHVTTDKIQKKTSLGIAQTKMNIATEHAVYAMNRILKELNSGS